MALEKPIKLKTFKDAEKILEKVLRKIFNEGDKCVINKSGTIANIINTFARIKEVSIKQQEFELLQTYEKRIAQLEAQRENAPEKIREREYEWANSILKEE